MNPARLNQKITIQRYLEYEDDYGISRQGWVDVKETYCAISKLSGKEYWTAKQYSAENTVEITFRYGQCRDLSITDRLVHKGTLYNIISIDNVNYKNEVLKVKAQEVVK